LPSSLLQGLALLEAAVERERSGRQSLTVTRLADAVGIERSRASRLTQELRALRYLERDEAAALTASDAYFSTAGALNEHWLGAARHELRALASRLRSTVRISAADGPATVLLRYEIGSGAPDPVIRPGMVSPIWCTGSGRALLWDHSRAQLETLLEKVQFIGVGGPNAARSVAEVEAHLERDRAAGIITAVDEYADGVTEIALPIRGGAGVIASVSVVVPKQGGSSARTSHAALREVRDRLDVLVSGF